MQLLSMRQVPPKMKKNLDKENIQKCYKVINLPFELVEKITEKIATNILNKLIDNF